MLKFINFDTFVCVLFFSHLLYFQDAFVPINVTNGIDSYDDFFNLLDEESRKQLAVISRK